MQSNVLLISHILLIRLILKYSQCAVPTLVIICKLTLYLRPLVKLKGTPVLAEHYHYYQHTLKKSEKIRIFSSNIWNGISGIFVRHSQGFIFPGNSVSTEKNGCLTLTRRYKLPEIYLLFGNNLNGIGLIHNKICSCNFKVYILGI